MYGVLFVGSIRSRLSMCALVPGVQTCALPISFQNLPGFGDKLPHALPAPQGVAFFDAIFGTLGGAAKGRKNGSVAVEIHRIVAPMPRRDNPAAKVEVDRKSTPLKSSH